MPEYLLGIRGPNRLRLSEFVQISELFSIYIADICQTSESFAKSVNFVFFFEKVKVSKPMR